MNNRLILNFNKNKPTLDFFSKLSKKGKEQKLCTPISKVRIFDYYNFFLRYKNLPIQSYSRPIIKNIPTIDSIESDIIDYYSAVQFVCDKFFSNNAINSDVEKYYLKYIDPFIHSFAINFKITYEIDNKFYPFCHNYDVNLYFHHFDFLHKIFSIYNDLRVLNQLIQLINLINIFSYKHNQNGLSLRHFHHSLQYSLEDAYLVHKFIKNYIEVLTLIKKYEKNINY